MRRTGASLDQSQIWVRQERLVKRAISGEPQALRELLLSKQQSIMYHALQILGDYHDAEDVAQEVIIRVCSNIAKLQNPRAFNAWLSRITAHQSYASLDKRRKRRQHECDINADEVTMPEAMLIETRRDLLPQDNLEHNLACERLREQIAALPLKYREILLMFYFEELSVKEIAKALDRPVPTVTSYLTRGREKLKELFERSATDENDRQWNLGKAQSFSALIASAFSLDANQSISADSTELLEKAINCGIEALAAGTAVATGSAVASASAAVAGGKLAAVTATLGTKIALGITSCALAGTALFATANFPPAEEKPAPAQAAAQTPQSEYAAEVVMHGGDGEGLEAVSVNPRSAVLTGNDVAGAQAISWLIVAENSIAPGQDISALDRGAVLASGTGANATAGLQTLPAAEAYSLLFEVTGEDGKVFYVMRDFMIAPKGAQALKNHSGT
ncbi:MAG: sigma-70 family RNA polymerase sigma factor [Coriobacteriales bacterium]|jgi:RNA polymerase sigma-70 factor (ECF subfamily)|nr:sigma-70 family RNA polymerase sigma factor [Coriobacteriales bacterium]